MTAYPTQLPAHAQPPAVERRNTPVLTGTTCDLNPISVPLFALRDDDVIRAHPETGESVVWKVADWRCGDGAYVTYIEQGSDEEHRFEFDEPHPMLLVEHPAGSYR